MPGRNDQTRPESRAFCISWRGLLKKVSVGERMGMVVVQKQLKRSDIHNKHGP